MTELTQKILSLDTQADTALAMSKKSAREMILQADSDAEKMINEVQKNFKDKKDKEDKDLSKELDQKRTQAQAQLKQKMHDFDEAFEIDTIINTLINTAKDKLCL